VENRILKGMVYWNRKGIFKCESGSSQKDRLRKTNTLAQAFIKVEE
jgi:hypothetical protein